MTIKDTTLFGTKAKVASNDRQCIVLYTFQQKYADTDWFTMAHVLFADGTKKGFNLDDLILGWD